MRLFKDTENNNIITEEALLKEFAELKQNSPEEYNYSFGEYVKNCTSKNGFLEEVKQ